MNFKTQEIAFKGLVRKRSLEYLIRHETASGASEKKHTSLFSETSPYAQEKKRRSIEQRKKQFHREQTSKQFSPTVVRIPLMQCRCSRRLGVFERGATVKSRQHSIRRMALLLAHICDYGLGSSLGDTIQVNVRVVNLKAGRWTTSIFTYRDMFSLEPQNRLLCFDSENHLSDLLIPFM